jgi:hypothetical protein
VIFFVPETAPCIHNVFPLTIQGIFGVMALNRQKMNKTAAKSTHLPLASVIAL